MLATRGISGRVHDLYLSEVLLGDPILTEPLLQTLQTGLATFYDQLEVSRTHQQILLKPRNTIDRQDPKKMHIIPQHGWATYKIQIKTTNTWREDKTLPNENTVADAVIDYLNSNSKTPDAP